VLANVRDEERCLLANGFHEWLARYKDSRLKQEATKNSELTRATPILDFAQKMGVTEKKSNAQKPEQTTITMKFCKT